MTPAPSGTVTADGHRFHAVVFDVDGVLTDTATLHRRAWKTVLDDVLTRHGQAGHPFTDDDYRTHVDGRARTDGIRAFLTARGITLPEYGPTGDTVTAIATRKNTRYNELLRAGGVPVLPGAADLLARLHDAGVPVAAVSASRNAATVLDRAGLSPHIDVRIDGIEAARLTLPGKPDPALFLTAARRLRVDPAHAIAVEDAVSGVTAAHRAGYGLVVGLAAPAHRRALRAAGADVVATDLAATATHWQVTPTNPTPD